MTAARLTSVAAALLVTLLAVPILAQQEDLHLPENDASAASTTLELMRGTAMVVSLPGGVDRIAVADEAVIQVTILSTEEILIHGLGVGRTTLYAWLSNREIRRYLVQVSHDLGLLRMALRDIDARIEAQLSPDGRSLVLTGDLDEPSAAEAAVQRAEQFLASVPEPRPILMNLLRSPPAHLPTVDERLREALRRIDPRIRLRRIQVGDTLSETTDSYVLEGRVETLQDLLRAVTIAERQLGGTGTSVQANDLTRVSDQRFRGVIGGGIVNQGGGLDALQGSGPLTSGLAAQVAKGLVVTSESGRVLSFLEVDRLDQILVSIRVLEIDRVKAKKRGIDYRIDGQDFSITAQNRGDLINLEPLNSAVPLANSLGTANLVGAYVSSSVAILGAIDFLQESDVARSVAEPNVMTLTGEQATVLVGGEVPIPTTSANEVVALQSFFFQSFGVRLDIRPTVDRDGVITMEIAPSIIQPESGLSVGGVPGFEVQTVETVARVRTGESLVIGGLLSYAEGVRERKVPIAGDIPIVSSLFKWRNRSREEQELLFVITPRVMENAVDGTPGPIELPSMRDINETGLRFQDEPQWLTNEGLPTSWIDKERQEWLDYVRRREALWRRDFLQRGISPAERHRILLGSEPSAPAAVPSAPPAIPAPVDRPAPASPRQAEPPASPEMPASPSEVETGDVQPLEPPTGDEPPALDWPAPPAPPETRRPGGFESMIESLLADEVPALGGRTTTEPPASPSPPADSEPAEAPPAMPDAPGRPEPAADPPAPASPADGEPPNSNPEPTSLSTRDADAEFDDLSRDMEATDVPTPAPLPVPNALPPIEPSKDLEEDIPMLDGRLRQTGRAPEESRAPSSPDASVRVSLAPPP